MRVRHILLVCLLTLCAPATVLAGEPHWGRMYSVPGTVPVREYPSDSALKVQVLKPGQKVRVDFQDDGWAAVFDPREPARAESHALGYAKLSELGGGNALMLAQATSIEVRKPAPDSKPEVLVNGKPAKSGQKASAKDPNSAKPESKAKPAAKGFGEIRVADRQLTVRATRDKDSEFRKVLKPGQTVRVDFLEDGWYAVFDPDEKTRDLKRAWGYSRDKYLVPESAYVPPPAEVQAPAVASAPAASHQPASADASALRKTHKSKGDDEAVGYAVVDRKSSKRNPPVTTLRVRLDMGQPPATEALRKIVREIWKAERKKNEELQLEVLLSGMDAHGLAYATARFHDDGRLREFWWRDVVIGKGKK